MTRGSWVDGPPLSPPPTFIEQLAQPLGSSLVGFLQSGTGAAPRTEQDKDRETVSVTDFYASAVSGAKVDSTGIVDSTLGIAAAMAALPNGGVVEFPPGTYLGKITSVPANITLRGYGATLKLPAGQAALTPVIALTLASNINIFGLSIDGNSSQNSQTGTQDGGMHGVRMYASSRICLRDVSIVNCNTDGIYVSDNNGSGSASSDITLERVNCNANTRNGLSVISVDGMVIRNCRFTNTSGKAPQAGMDIEPNFSSQVVNDVTVDSCIITGNAGRGFVLDAEGTAKGIRLLSCRIGSNGAEDIVFTGVTGSVTRNVTVRDCRTTGNVAIQAGGGNTLDYESMNIVNNEFGAAVVMRDFTSHSGLLLQGNYIVQNVDAARVSGVRVSLNRFPVTAAVANNVLVASTCADFHITDNLIEGATAQSIIAAMTSGSIVGNTVIGNVSTQDVIVGQALVGVRIANNRITAGRDGISIISTSSDCEISGNNISGGRNGILIAQGARYRIIGNRVNTGMGNGYDFTSMTDSLFDGNNANACVIGARFNSASGNNAIVGNVLMGNTTNLSNGGTGNQLAGNIAP